MWPGGGITVMADVTKMPKNAFGYVPTPALVAPIEFTLRRSDYERLGGHMECIRSVQNIAKEIERSEAAIDDFSWPVNKRHFSWDE